MKGRLVQSHAERVRRIESGDLKVVGVNAFTETAPSPLADSAQTRRHRDDRPRGRARAGRGDRGVAARARQRRGRRRARTTCAKAAATDENLVPATDRARPSRRHGRRVGRRAAGGVRRVPRADGGRRGVGAGPATSCEEVRAGVAGRRRRPPDPASSSASPASTATRTAPSRSRSPPATPAWRSSTRASGSRPAQIAAAARDEDVDIVGLSILSGSHLALVPETLRLLREAGVTRRSWSAGSSRTVTGPSSNGHGIARVFTPKDYRLGGIMSEVADLALAHRSAQARAATRR